MLNNKDIIPNLTFSELVIKYRSKFVIEENDCWVWYGARGERGYGSITIDNRTIPAHRVFYERKYNTKLSAKQEAHHKCGTRSCINPDHIEIVDNKIEHKRKHLVLSEEQINEVIRLHEVNKLPCTLIARRYNVSDVTILTALKSRGIKSGGRRGVTLEEVNRRVL